MGSGQRLAVTLFYGLHTSGYLGDWLNPSYHLWEVYTTAASGASTGMSWLRGSEGPGPDSLNDYEMSVKRFLALAVLL